MTPQQRLIHFERRKVLDHIRSISQDRNTPTEVRQWFDRVAKEIDAVKHRVGV